MKQDREEALTLEILNAIDSQSDFTQRNLASQLGVALGLANSYLRRCVRKGLVKIQHAPANRYLYYLTPQGFAEKSRLTGEYLVSGLDYYNRAGLSMEACYRRMSADARRTVLFAGMSELAEIALVRAYDSDLEIVGTFDEGATVDRFIGRPVWRRVEDAGAFDAVLLTDLAQTVRTHERLESALEADRIYVPGILWPVLSPETSQAPN